MEILFGGKAPPLVSGGSGTISSLDVQPNEETDPLDMAFAREAFLFQVFLFLCPRVSVAQNGSIIGLGNTLAKSR